MNNEQRKSLQDYWLNATKEDVEIIVSPYVLSLVTGLFMQRSDMNIPK